MVYYNPATRPDIAKTMLTREHIVCVTDTFYNRYVNEAYPSREAALADDTSTTVSFFEYGELYQATRIASFEFKPLLKDGEVVPGINWNDAYFLTKIAAEEFASTCGCRNNGVRYNSIGDVYSVHYHWIDVQDDYRNKKPLSKMTLD